jgi:hypothetical protein
MPIFITSKRGDITSKRGDNINMLESIFGNATVEKVLLYLQNFIPNGWSATNCSFYGQVNYHTSFERRANDIY